MNLSDRMQAKQANARAEITTMLWATEPDLDKIADLALAAGIAPQEIDSLAAGVDKARAILEDAVAAQKSQAGTTKAITEAGATVAKLDAELVELQSAFDQAAQALSDAERSQAAQQSAIGTAAQAFRRGEILAAQAPKWLKDSVKLADAQAATQARASRSAALSSSKRYRETRVEGLQAELDGIDTKDPHAQSVVATAGGLIDYRTSLQSRIDAEKSELKKITAELRTLARK